MSCRPLLPAPVFFGSIQYSTNAARAQQGSRRQPRRPQPAGCRGQAEHGTGTQKKRGGAPGFPLCCPPAARSIPSRLHIARIFPFPAAPDLPPGRPLLPQASLPDALFCPRPPRTQGAPCSPYPPALPHPPCPSIPCSLYPPAPLSSCSLYPLAPSIPCSLSLIVPLLPGPPPPSGRPAFSTAQRRFPLFPLDLRHKEGLFFPFFGTSARQISKYTPFPRRFPAFSTKLPSCAAPLFSKSFSFLSSFKNSNNFYNFFSYSH